MINIYDNDVEIDNKTEEEERKYFLSVLSTFKSYRKQSLLRVEKSEKYLTTLPKAHQLWLTNYQKDLDEIKRCIEHNASVISLIIKDSNNMFANVENENPTTTEAATLSEGVDKVQSVFKQLMRDWSSYGEFERKQCYEPIIEEIERKFPEDECDRTKIKVLVPGAGLGRLAFEIATRDFICQGNEFNLFMLIVSFFVLNRCHHVDEYEVYPWLHQYVNNLNVKDQLLSIKFPDVKPSATQDSFTMAAGDFLEVYQTPCEWDCIATCFFLDCASNIVQFIETIYKILVPGGVWINLGPLLYHYSDMKSHESIEPSYDVICEVIRKVGFEIEKTETGIKSKYCQNPRSMLQYEYQSVFFVCKKPLDIHNDRLH